jgi:hypothetical protein
MVSDANERTVGLVGVNTHDQQVCPLRQCRDGNPPRRNQGCKGQSRVPRFDAAGASDQNESVTTTYHLLSVLHRNLLVTAVTRGTPEDRHLPNKFDYQAGPNTRPRKAT